MHAFCSPTSCVLGVNPCWMDLSLASSSHHQSPAALPKTNLMRWGWLGRQGQQELRAGESSFVSCTPEGLHTRHKGHHRYPCRQMFLLQNLGCPGLARISALTTGICHLRSSPTSVLTVLDKCSKTGSKFLAEQT